MFSWFRKRKQMREVEKYSQRGVFYYSVGKTTVVIDPLKAYVQLKEIGLDVMFEDVQGALKGNEAKITSFVNNAQKAFDVYSYDPYSNTGMTVLDFVRLYLAFYRYLAELKKNVILLRDFAPGLEESLKRIYEGSKNGLESVQTSSLSEQTTTPQTLSPLPDSQTTTEQAEPSEE